MKLGLGVLLLAGCVYGAPPAFSSGSQWTFPLVDPLDDGLLVTPVMVHGAGPFLMVIDPDALLSVIDERVVIAAGEGARVDKGDHVRVRGVDGTWRPRFSGEVRGVKINDLTIERLEVLVVPHETFAQLDTRRDIRGILGRDVIADSLVLGVDRDRGIATLTTAQAFHAPADAEAIHTELVRTGGSDNRDAFPTARATIGSQQFTLQVSLARQASRLRPEPWTRAGLADEADATAPVEVDEIGVLREIKRVGVAPRVGLGRDSATERVAFTEFADRREVDGDQPERVFDGVLGLDYFAPYRITADWHGRVLYLAHRADPGAQTAARLARWSALAACAHPGCVTVNIAAPSEAGGVVHVIRDPGTTMPLFVRLRAVGHPELPPLVVQLPSTSPDALAHLPASFAGTTLELLDASPFVR